MKRAVSFIAILLGDIISLVLSFYSAYYLRVTVIPSLFTIDNPYFFPVDHFYKMYYLIFVFILIFYYEKLYTRRFNYLEELVYITRGMFISVGLIAILIYLSRTYEIFSRTIPILMLVTGMLIVPVVRFIIKKTLMALGLYTKYAAVVGKKEYTQPMIGTLKKVKSTGYKIVEVVEPNMKKLERVLDMPVNSSGDMIETLIIVSKGMDKDRLNTFINKCETLVKEIKIVSDSTYLKTIGVDTEYIDELLVMRMSNNLLSPMNRVLKRVFDLVVSLLSMVVLLPLFLLIALLIKLDSRGPVMFIQDRFGLGGKRFKLLKFRTMYRDADEKLKEYLEQHTELKEEWECFKKLKTRDPRVTRVGKFLRRFSLDEAPQLFNIIAGDMSIVGPRPYLPREADEIKQSAAIIFRVKSGLTGLWQIRGRSELSFETRLKLDEFYVRNWSFFLDVMIMLRTFGAVIRGKGAY